MTCQKCGAEVRIPLDRDWGNCPKCGKPTPNLEHKRWKQKRVQRAKGDTEKQYPELFR